MQTAYFSFRSITVARALVFYMWCLIFIFLSLFHSGRYDVETGHWQFFTRFQDSESNVFPQSEAWVYMLIDKKRDELPQATIVAKVSISYLFTKCTNHNS